MTWRELCEIWWSGSRNIYVVWTINQCIRLNWIWIKVATIGILETKLILDTTNWWYIFFHICRIICLIILPSLMIDLIDQLIVSWCHEPKAILHIFTFQISRSWPINHLPIIVFFQRIKIFKFILSCIYWFIKLFNIRSSSFIWHNWSMLLPRISFVLI